MPWTRRKEEGDGTDNSRQQVEDGEMEAERSASVCLLGAEMSQPDADWRVGWTGDEWVRAGRWRIGAGRGGVG